MGFYFFQNTKFLIPITTLFWLLPVDRARSRSTESVDRRAQNVHASLAGGAVDRQRASALWKAFCRPGDRPGREHCSLFPDSVDRAVDRPESRCSLDLARSTAGLNSHFFDRWPVDRPANLGLFFCQRADSKWGL